MAIKPSNKLLPVLAGFVLFVVIAAIFMFTQTDMANNMDLFSVKSKRAKEVNVDGDTAVNTLQTIAVDLADNKSKYKDVNETVSYQQNQLNEFSRALKELTDTNAALKRKLDEQTRSMEAIKESGSSGTIDLSKIKEDIIEQIKTKLPSPPSGLNTDDYSVNALSDATGITDKVEKTGSAIKKMVVPETSTRMHSINVPVDENGSISPAYLEQIIEKHEEQTKPTVTYSIKQKGPIIDPRYTIFANSILNDSVSVTTLIGRIPRDGDLGDAAPFKVIIGRENLSANGFDIPGLDGMIMSGTVFGDANLECVRGKIYSATYIFEDGRGITFPKRQRRNNPLGWISDNRGNPCIPGKYITNAKTQLKNKILLAFAAGAANAYASAQTTSTSNSSGGTNTSITGDSGKYILGNALSDGSKEISNFLDQQRFDVWDVVVVPSGQKVAVHIEQTLELDQSSLQRKVVYDQNTHAEYGLTD